MLLTEERLAQLMAYCRLDDLTPEEESLLELFYGNAISYMKGAGVQEPADGSTRRCQYDLCVNALVLDAWDRRGSSMESRVGQTMTENRSFRLSLNQLKLTEPPVSDLNTAGLKEMD